MMLAMTLNEFLSEWGSPSPYVKVHTSGSTGKPKELMVEKSRMVASAEATCDFLGLRPGDTALLCMSLDYIAGKMMVVRSIVRGLRLICVPPSSTPLDSWQDSCRFSSYRQDGNSLSVEAQGVCPLDLVAMVPMQVKRSLHDPHLREVRNIIIGGGAIDDELETALRTFPNNIYSSYGMTETLSHIALRRVSGPEASLWYAPLPGVSLSLTSDSCLVIHAPRVCSEPVVTNDIAEIQEGRFRILGRKDNVINSGGVKIQIEEVERLIPSDSVQITSAPDPLFGEAVVMLLLDSVTPDEQSAIAAAVAELPRYWRPKRTIRVSHLPKTGTGKPDRAEAKRLAVSHK